jgi:uncharacterized protein YhbP (UPF0306 family)
MGAKIVQGSLQDPRVQRSVASILRRNVLCSMATVSPRGIAHISTAYFAYSPRLELVFFSHPDSRHSRNLTRNSTMAIALFVSSGVWGSKKPERGLQLFGRCRVASGALGKRMAELYARRFPGFWRWQQSVTRKEGRFSWRAYRFMPTSLKLFDDRLFGSGVLIVARVPETREVSGFVSHRPKYRPTETLRRL